MKSIFARKLFAGIVSGITLTASPTFTRLWYSGKMLRSAQLWSTLNI